MNTSVLEALRDDLNALADSEQARHLPRFFKTGKGDYGEGDRFLGIRVPQQRQLVNKYRDQIGVAEVEKLLHSEFHEHRLTALLLWVQHYQNGDTAQREAVYSAYLANTAWINSWDLVDSTAHHIVGAHLLRRSREGLYRLAEAKNLWQRRIAIISTLYFIKNDDFAETLQLAEYLLHDQEDLIHKAVGWMLREVGKRDRAAEAVFLQQYAALMPRTMLRYAIEKFSPEKRQYYMRYGRTRGSRLATCTRCVNKVFKDL